MIFDSLEEVQYYAAGYGMEIVIVDNQVIDVTEFKASHPGTLTL